MSWLDEVVDDQKLLLNSKIFPFRYFLWGNIANVYEMYRSGSGLVKRRTAFWSLKEGLNFIGKSQYWKRRHDLTGIKIRAGSISNPPFTIIKQRHANGQIELEGIVMDIFEGLQNYFNFR